MYLHKENRDLFRDAILLTSERLNVSEDIVEKDYYVTLILQKLAVIDYPIVFKGGTSLSKAYKLIDRFSEDIDVAFTEHLGEARRKKLKYNILKPIADELGLEIKNFNLIQSDRDLNHYDFYYKSVVGDKVSNPIPVYVKLETALKSYAFPTDEQMIGNYLLDALGKEEPELIRKYGLAEFPMRVQALARTLIDKIFAVCDYYLQNKPRRNARHLYDICKLASRVEIDDSFMKLVEEVRDHRITLGTEVAPAAPRNVDILELASKICKEDFYKEDYKDTTIKLISDNPDYEMLRDFYLELVNKIF
jgi:predicted nucleotidyltransferase component of viral defense system